SRLELRAQTMDAGYRDLALATDRVREFFQSRGVREGEIEPAAVTAQEIHERNAEGRETDYVSGYGMTQLLTVRSNSLERTTALSRSSAALVAATGIAKLGVTFRASSPEYRFSRLEDLKLEVLTAATKNAGQRAEKLAVAAGARLVGVLSAELGDIQVTNPD